MANIYLGNSKIGGTKVKGSAGQWKTVLDNLGSVNNALIKCGGEPLENTYWTSTLYDASEAWCAIPDTFTLNRSYKHSVFYLSRPFAPI